ncbi:sensor histidine kinase [Clostridium paraputrificum]|uniref:sensor histidine kinase n=1 Tax=Clostridium TaxID=1485 RepID=UPI003D340A82
MVLRAERKVEVDNLTKEELISIVRSLEEKVSLQENFLLNISHDLRNPINVILSIVQCIQSNSKENNDFKLSPKGKEYRDLIKRNSLKMIKLIDNLIDTTKLEGNFYRLNKSNIDIISMVEATVTSIDEYAEQKEIQLVFDTNVEECISAVDPQALDRIVMNLLSNAIKFSPKGSHIFIDVLVDDKNIKISVKDEGPGIPLEEQELIFNRFVQSTQNKRGEYTGSGIGLDLVNYLTKAHDGLVKLVSKEGKGSEFKVIIPKKIIENQKRDCEFVKKNKVEQLEIEFSDIYL